MHELDKSLGKFNTEKNKRISFWYFFRILVDNDTHTENYQLHLTVICTVKLKTGVELQLSELNSNFTLMRKGLHEEVFVHAASYKSICVLRSILLTVVSLFTLMAFGQTVV